ncbi:EP300-interacting inhibitor of differentiation 3 [Strongylocentrotus purpuratus]|uniref:Non-structural maintenance of chromosomes element 4 n=1 Tax=Strongylocentrotus purpuratus TaxID=7668 RepID=A0A7M7LL45_STRPU|nr:EP300-interacting inhibitor of differentiation 3 [Strongylocentrotus purpuratus]XP_011662006.1 EP300-interacting inhibitor of differentiation 3 [Strongylocentrotus purpuratus]|eukprot:XP_003724484.1 PREDICTED: EP300-interacting inhibitor of differentiation 3 isoform X2 [Strongylocentrotus purpuratus]
MTEQNGRRGGRGDGASQESDINERRELRRDYRELIAETKRESSELVRPDSDGLGNLLERSDELFGQVIKLPNRAPTVEAVLDAQFLMAASSLGCQKAKKIHVDNKFDPKDFVQKLISFMECRRLGIEDSEIEEEHWATLGRGAAPAFRSACSFQFMLGTFEREPPRKAARKTKDANAEEQAGPAIVAKQLKSKDKDKTPTEVTSEEVEKMVAILHQVCKTRGDGTYVPISYFDLVINPESFSQTVENIFHLSFLLKDGHAKVYLDNDDLPVIVPCTPFNEEQEHERVTKKQVLVSIDMDQWKELIEVFDINDPLIPTRPEPPHSNGNM